MHCVVSFFQAHERVELIANLVLGCRDAAIRARLGIAASMNLHPESTSHSCTLQRTQVAPAAALMLWAHRVVASRKWPMVGNASALWIVLAIGTLGALVVPRDEVAARKLWMPWKVGLAIHRVSRNGVSAVI